MRSTRTTRIRFALGIGLVLLLTAACANVGDTDATEDTTAAEDDGTAADDADVADDAVEAGEPVPEDGAMLVEAEEGVEEVVFWTSHTQESDVDALTSIVESFNAENDDLQISMVQVPGAETDAAKLMTAVRGGIGPDLYLLDRFTVAERAAAGVLEPVGDHLQVNQGGDYVDFAWQEVLYDGEPYGLPFDTDVRALWYRADLLEEAGIDFDALDPENGPPTLDEVREISDAFDEEDDSGYTRMGFVPWLEQGWHFTWGYAHGGDFFDADSCEVTPTEPGVLAAFEFMHEWAQDKGPQDMQSFLDAYNPPEIPIPQTPIMQGRVAMMISGEWWIALIDRYAEEDMDFRVTYVPVAEDGADPVSWSGGWSMVIPTGTENVENAVRAMEYMAGPEGQEIYAVESNHLPTLTALSDVFDTEVNQFFVDLVPHSNNRPPLPVGVQYWDELTTAQEAVTLGQAEPAEALENVGDRVQQRLERYCPLDIS